MFLIKKKGIKISLMAGLLSFSIGSAVGQVPAAVKGAPKALTDTAKKNPSAFKSYKEVVPSNAFTQKSFFKVHLVKDRYLLEIPDSLLKRDILAVTRIEKGGAGFIVPLFNIGYAGDELGRQVIEFDRIPGDKLVMRTVIFKQFASDTSANGLSRSLNNNIEQGIQAVFPVKTVNKEQKSTVIDLTDFLSGKAMTDALVPPLPLVGNIFGTLAADRSYISKVRAFPLNIEIGTVKSILDKGSYVSMELNTSLLLLPEEPMKPRIKDPRIGFFSNTYENFDTRPYGADQTRYIQRWRMEPKAEDVEKYKLGELVEPKKPIVIYIDPATPKKWVPYLIAGINDWQVAFEKAGFKNAIIGMEAPKGDTTWSMYDARHSVIVYKPSSIPNASGPNVNDPRSGEILETHINWYHQVMSMIQNWYTVQAGAIDPRTHKPNLDDELMGQLIRFVSSHEVGHTLGLEHNFGASSTVPVEKLRDKAWVEAHGHTPSIMDYARFNYVAQPEDQIGAKGIFPRIGDYDKWAIEWGYRWLPQFKKAEEEKSYLNKWIIAKLASGKQYFYGSQLYPLTDTFPLNEFDPRDQSEDLGDDAMLASSYGIKNLKRIVPHVMEWFKEPDGNYTRSSEVYTEIVTEFERFMGHVTRNIGGMYITPKTVEQGGPQYEPVPKAKQQRAMAFLQKELFSTPYWLKNDSLFLNSSVDFSTVTTVQQNAIKSLLKAGLIDQMLVQEKNFPGKAYTAMEMLTELKNGIFSELPVNKPITSYRAALQSQYVTILIDLLKKGGLGERQTIIAAHARSLAAELKRAAPTGTLLTREHLRQLLNQLELALDPKNMISVPVAPKTGTV